MEGVKGWGRGRAGGRAPEESVHVGQDSDTTEQQTLAPERVSVAVALTPAAIAAPVPPTL